MPSLLALPSHTLSTFIAIMSMTAPTGMTSTSPRGGPEGLIGSGPDGSTGTGPEGLTSNSGRTAGSMPSVTFSSVQPSTQAASAAFIQHIRQTLQRAQDITQAVAEAENIADEATKFCEAIKAQHNIHPKKLALSGKPSAPAPPLTASLTREIQTSVVWTQSMLQMCTIAESSSDIQNGEKLKFVKAAPDS